MKKLLCLLLGLSSLFLLSSYFLIPDEIVISDTEEIESSERIVSKYLQSRDHRLKWWPEIKSEASAKTDSLIYKQKNYVFQNPSFNSQDIHISAENLNLKSTMSWLPYSSKLIRLRWEASLPAGRNPVKRFVRYQQARRIKSDMTFIMEQYLAFITNPREVYGYDFKIQTVTDTLLATANFNSAAYPENARIYREINKLKTHLKRQGVDVVNPPMLNISKNAQGRYQTTLALPVGRRFQPDESVLLRNMVPGNILVTEVKGGPKAISNGFRQMEVFMKDFRLSSPAIPFESLVTDRTTQTDSSKWITKIYYPIY